MTGLKTLIVVEDEFRIRDGLSRLIQRLNMGVKVIGEAENGLEGLKMIQDLQPDIVITDIRMPKIEGLEMIRKAREMNMDCTFIILSGYAEFSYAQTANFLWSDGLSLKTGDDFGCKKITGKTESPKRGCGRNVRRIFKSCEYNHECGKA